MTGAVEPAPRRDGRAGEGADRGRARVAPAVARPSAAGRSAPRSRRSCTARSGAGRRGDGSAESYIGPVLDGARAATGEPPTSATSASARRPTSAPGAGGMRCAPRDPAARRVPIERFAPLARAVATRARLWRDRHRMRRALWASADAARAAQSSAAATAGRSSARSSPASRCCSGRGRRARWTKPAPRSTRSQPRVAVTYAEAGGWGRALVLECRRRGDSARRPAARLHLPPLAELPARSRTRWRPIRRIRPTAASPPRRRRCSSTTTPRATSREHGRFPAGRAGRDRQPAARRARRPRRAALTPADIERARARRRRRRLAAPLVLVAAKYTRGAARAAARSSTPWRRCRTSSWRSRRIPPRRRTSYAAVAAGAAERPRAGRRRRRCAPLLARGRARSSR